MGFNWNLSVSPPPRSVFHRCHRQRPFINSAKIVQSTVKVDSSGAKTMLIRSVTAKKSRPAWPFNKSARSSDVWTDSVDLNLWWKFCIDEIANYITHVWHSTTCNVSPVGIQIIGALSARLADIPFELCRIQPLHCVVWIAARFEYHLNTTVAATPHSFRGPSRFSIKHSVVVQLFTDIKRTTRPLDILIITEVFW